MTNGYITDCEIYNNEVNNTYSYSYANCAGVYVDNNSNTKKAVVENCYVHDNYSQGYGGGIPARKPVANPEAFAGTEKYIRSILKGLGIDECTVAFLVE